MGAIAKPVCSVKDREHFVEVWVGNRYRPQIVGCARIVSKETRWRGHEAWPSDFLEVSAAETLLMERQSKDGL